MARMRKKLGAVLLSAAALSLTLTACGGGGGGAEAGGGGSEGGTIDTSNASGDVSYWLWDANQLPAYQACADKFKQANPNINVKITQYGWDDYWGKLTNGFVAGDAPDVFTDHLAKYPEFVSQEQLVPLDDDAHQGRRSTSTSTRRAGGSVEGPGWQALRPAEGLRHRRDLLQQEAGRRRGHQRSRPAESPVESQRRRHVREDDRPSDGGSRAESAETSQASTSPRSRSTAWDSTAVRAAAVGQTQWSMYTGSNNWQFTDKNPWGTHYNYDQPAFQDTIEWFASLVEKGYMPSVAAVTGQAEAAIFAAGKYAMATNGSWNIGSFFGAKGIETGVAPPRPGRAASAPACTTAWPTPIWAGSKNKPAAAKWVEFLGSPDCQNIVGEKAVVFPAIPSATDKAEAAFKAKGVDVTAFLVNVKDKTTFLFPITDHASQIDGIMHPAMDDVLSGKAPVDIAHRRQQPGQSAVRIRR